MENCNNSSSCNSVYKCFVYIFIFAFIQVALVSSVFAKTNAKKYDQLIKNRNKDISALDGKLKAIEREKRKLKNKKNQQIKLLNKVNSEIELTGKIIRKLSDNKEGLERDITTNQEAISVEREHYEQLQDEVNKIMKNMYVNHSQKNMQLLINYKEFHKVEHAVVYNTYFYKKGVMLLDSLKAIEEGLKEKGEVLTEQLDEVEVIQNKTLSRKKKLSSTKNERKKLVNNLKNNEKALELELADIESEKRSIELIIKTLEAKRKRSLKKGAKARVIKKEDLVMPVKGKIVRKFGKYRDPKYKTTLINKGIDIKVAKNASIKSSAEGYVVKAGYFRNLKNYIIIEHSKGVYTFYSKLEHINVLEGDKVKRGTIIGNMKGSKTNILHFEVRKGKNAVDPLKYIKR